MKREQVYVLVDTPEKCKRAYNILIKNNQSIYPTSKEPLKSGISNEPDKIEFYLNKWLRVFNPEPSKTEISLDELEEMLGGGKATMRDEFKCPELTYKDSEEIFTTEKRINNCIEKILIDYPEKDKIHIDLVELINSETSELRKQLEEKDKEYARVVGDCREKAIQLTLLDKQLQQKQEEVERLKANNSACIKEVIEAQKLADERLRHYSETTKQVICYRELMDRMADQLAETERLLKTVVSDCGGEFEYPVHPIYNKNKSLLTDYQTLKK